ncbi:MAG TPA: YchJ family metal-binding protein [Polyangium sp.]|nr:YchJ family metal-binding protein [Polyangium sp.]
MPTPRDCPCCSGAPYANCCAPFHRGEREAPTPEALMRSRYAAYANKLTPYIHRTLHPRHEDRNRPENEVLREIRDAVSTLRFMHLDVLDREDPNEEGLARVLFHARVFEKGQNRSFIELSDFLHDGIGWRYVQGRQIPASRAKIPEKVDIAQFRVLLGKTS